MILKGKNMVLLGNAKDINKDVELCRTTNERISNQATQLLIENQIPFTKNLIRIPFFLRDRFHGAQQIYVISTNRNRYGPVSYTHLTLPTMAVV